MAAVPVAPYLNTFFMLKPPKNSLKGYSSFCSKLLSKTGEEEFLEEEYSEKDWELSDLIVKVFEVLFKEQISVDSYL